MSLLLALSGVVVALLALRVWQHWLVVRFFRRAVPATQAKVGLVSILQPILSGDPLLAGCLEANLRARSGYQREFLWLVDEDDPVGQELAAELIGRYPEVAVRLVLLPPPGERQNPKMVKLIAGLALARGDVICVLDDDTVLPDGGLERCLPYLDLPNVGIAFGLPYYRSFATIWSSLVAYFVNSHSLLTYVPYTTLTEPVTINGMFYALRRSVLELVGGFQGLEETLADDFAVAQRFRMHGFQLVQTPLCHGISTYIGDARHYLSLLQRWFIFPRESLLRYLGAGQLALLYGLVVLPLFAPWLALLLVVLWPGVWTVALVGLVIGYHYAIFAQLNRDYFGRAAPWGRSWWVPVVQFTIPLQVVVALLAPQRIAWRGHQLEVLPGGGLRFVRRRTE